jgi:alkylhydroperoxidase family enzyme
MTDRIRPLQRDEAHPDAQRFFDQDERAFGLVLNPTRVLAYRPPILAAMRGLNRSVGQDAVLPAGLRALICVRIATLVGCPF